MKCIFILFPIFFACVLCSANVNRTEIPFIENYTKQEYKGGTQNWDIVQTPNGLMYFANNDGILEFDGNGWNLIKMPNRSVVRSLAVDVNGRVYVGAYNEFGYLKPNLNGQLVYQSLVDSLLDNHQSIGDVWNIFPLEDGVLFHSFESIMFFHDGQITTVRSGAEFHYSFRVNDQIFIRQKHKGIFQIIGMKLLPVPGGEVFAEDEVVAMMTYSDDRILIATAEHALFLYDGVEFIPWNLPISEQLKTFQIFSALRLDPSHFVLGTVRNGIYILNLQGEVIYHVSRDNGIQNNTILSLFVDRDHNLWAGLDNGIDFLQTSLPFSFYDDDVLQGAGYASIVYDGMLYMGTNMGLFCRPYDKSDRENGIHEDFELVQNTEGQVWSLQNIGGELICGHNRGTFRIEGKKGFLISQVAGAWKYLYKSKFPNKMIGGTYTGLVLFERSRSNEHWHFVKQIDGFKQSSREILWDNDNSIWMCHGYEGVYHIFLDDDFEECTDFRYYGKDDGFLSNLNINVYLIRGKKVFSSDHGFFQYEAATDRFVADSSLNHLFGGPVAINKMIIDKNENIWFFKDDEIGLLTLQLDNSYKVIRKPFTPLKGMLIGSFASVEVLDDESVIIGTDLGFVHYNPQKIKVFNSPFYVLIRNVFTVYPSDSLVFHGSSDLYNLRKENRIEKSDATLPFKKNALRFCFSAPYYETPYLLKYRFQLEGFEESISPWSDMQQKEYTNLHEGDYVLRYMLKINTVLLLIAILSILLYLLHGIEQNSFLPFISLFLSF